MGKLSSYVHATTLTGTELVPIVVTPGIVGGNAYITADEMVASSLPPATQKVVYVSATGLDTNSGRGPGLPLKTFAAALTAIGAGNAGHIEMGVGVIDMGVGVSLSGHRVTFSGQGESTVLTATAQSGPVLDFTGYLSPNNASYRRVIGRFRVQGDGAAGATNKGINFAGVSGMTFTDISIDSTGGACFDYGASQLSDFVRLIANQPVSANANDVAYHQASDACNGNRFTGCACRSITTNPEGVSGAVRFLDGATYAGEYNQHNGWWFEYLHVPTNGCLIWSRGCNENSWNDTQFFDCAPVGGATGTSFVKFDVGTYGGNGGNTWRGVLPGSSGSWATGIAMNQSRNSVIGPKGYNGGNIILGVNVEYTNVIFTGRVSGTGANAGFVDNSTKTTNLILDMTNGVLLVSLGTLELASTALISGTANLRAGFNVTGVSQFPTFRVDTAGTIFWGPTGSGADCSFSRRTTNTMSLTGAQLEISTVGRGLSVKEGSNAKQGVVTLVAGAAVVSNTAVTATSRIMLTAQSLGTVTTPKALAVTARTASTSFTVTSADATDTSVVAYELFEASP